MRACAADRRHTDVSAGGLVVLICKCLFKLVVVVVDDVNVTGWCSRSEGETAEKG